MPKQLTSSEISVDLSGVATAGQAALGVTMAFSFILKAILNQLLGLIDSLSIITHMFCISLNYPANVSDFFGSIFPLISFNLIPFDDINNNIWRF